MDHDLKVDGGDGAAEDCTAEWKQATREAYYTLSQLHITVGCLVAVLVPAFAFLNWMIDLSKPDSERIRKAFVACFCRETTLRQCN